MEPTERSVGGLRKTSSKQLQRRFITFLTNQGFWSGGIRNKAGLEAPCGACSAHSAALRTQQCSWKPSATQLGLVTSLLHRMHFSHTEGAGMCPASQGCLLCRLSTLQPLFGLLKGLRQLPVNCAYQCCQLLYKTCRNQTKAGWGRHRFSWEHWERCCAAHHSRQAHGRCLSLNLDRALFFIVPGMMLCFGFRRKKCW